MSSVDSENLIKIAIHNFEKNDLKVFANTRWRVQKRPIYTLWVRKNWATFIFIVTLANVGRFFKFFQCRNQKEMAHNKNEKFPTIA